MGLSNEMTAIQERAEMKVKLEHLEKENESVKQEQKETRDAIVHVNQEITEIKHMLEKALSAVDPINKDLMQVKNVTEDYTKTKTKIGGGLIVLFMTFGLIWEFVRILLKNGFERFMP